LFCDANDVYRTVHRGWPEGVQQQGRVMFVVAIMLGRFAQRFFVRRSDVMSFISQDSSSHRRARDGMGGLAIGLYVLHLYR